ncbi:maltose acetyltransferase domain-containing protein [Secundilactobacillus kimchicus]|uniref:maltose acetyltransferase domain-containing protein n=1 Tax=Secundilactobacillus kimchicus TaxID=528209 RepID=UPI002436DB34|nr:maltose acetyltransferase domain-containing protein [Secundilactobacillus kimchicus]
MDNQIEYERMMNGELYHQTPELLEMRMKARDLLYDYNQLHYRDLDSRKKDLEGPIRSSRGKLFY